VSLVDRVRLELELLAELVELARLLAIAARELELWRRELET
jgi:hypothetical protein